MAACLLEVVRFLFLPPRLSSLDRIASDQTHFRFWGLLNELGYGSTGRFLRPLWRHLPRTAVYRLIVVPLLTWHLARASLRASRSRHAEHLHAPANELFSKILAAILRYPGLRPDDYFIYGLHLSANVLFAEKAADNLQTRFLVDLSTMDRPVTDHRFSNVANNKREFHDLVRAHGFPAAKMLAVFDKDIEWIEARELPGQDLFLKPVSGTLSIGASVVSFDGDSNQYQIQPPAVPFPKKQNVPDYPPGNLSGIELVEALKNFGKKVPLVIQPKLRCHPDLQKLTGSSQLATCRVISVRAIGSAPELLGAYLRMPADERGTDAFASGGIAASLDLETGQFLCAKKKYEDEALRAHPLTGEVFDRLQMPFARDVFSACRAVHEALAVIDEVLVPIVGFDVAIADDGYWFMEANCPCDLQFQKLGVPYGSDGKYIRCVQSHLALLRGRSRISVDPFLRRSQR